MRCRECGYYTTRWLGRCPECGSWGSMEKSEERGKSRISPQSHPLCITDIPVEEEKRITCGIGEVDRVLGGGIVPGAVVLLGGDPGIGKSTLLMQLACEVARSGCVLYVSGEESALQVRLRAERLGTVVPGLYLVCENIIDNVIASIEDLNPVLVVIDSIQTMYQPELQAVPGSVGQVRECALKLTALAKTRGIPIFLVGHVTKEGALAGPRVLEHTVDVVLYLEGERHHSFRILRGVKNRFGSTNEIGVFEMQGEGLIEVDNPSRLFISPQGVDVPGSVVVCSLEGSRPLLVEIQALVAPTGYGTPRRMTAGVDYNRVVLMAAVLEKRVGLSLSNHDIYVNVVGGVKLAEPAVDLGIALALASSFREQAVPSRTIVVGEIGLTGEVRPVRAMEKRVKEAAKLGFKRAVLPGVSLCPGESAGLELQGVNSLEDAIGLLLRG
ncbi:MAG: DNA repair protein RadA [Peptococcaceae bacterium]|nr:DNA repair protein RadA [Peptococcaceae bacterium]